MKASVQQKKRSCNRIISSVHQLLQIKQVELELCIQLLQTWRTELNSNVTTTSELTFYPQPYNGLFHLDSSIFFTKPYLLNPDF